MLTKQEKYTLERRILNESSFLEISKALNMSYSNLKNKFNGYGNLDDETVEKIREILNKKKK